MSQNMSCLKNRASIINQRERKNCKSVISNIKIEENDRHLLVPQIQSSDNNDSVRFGSITFIKSPSQPHIKNCRPTEQQRAKMMLLMTSRKKENKTLEKIEIDQIANHFANSQLNITTNILKDMPDSNSKVFNKLYKYNLNLMKENQQVEYEIYEDYNSRKLDPNSQVAKIERLERANRAYSQRNK